MKYLSLTLALILAACASDKQDGPIPGSYSYTLPANAMASRSLEKSESLSEADAVSAASVIAATPVCAFSDSIALRCWEREAFRPNVREACLLAWAANGVPSKEMTDVLRTGLESGSPSRAMLLAAARREDFVRSLSASELARLLTSLKGEPAWLREVTAIRWIKANRATAPEQLMVFNSAASAGDDASPYSVGAGIWLANLLGLPPIAETALDRDCPKGLTGLAVTRCLRILSAVADPKLGGLTSYLRLLLPPSGDPGVPYYKLSFPGRPSLY